MAYEGPHPFPIHSGGTNATSIPNAYGTVYYDGTKLTNTTVGTSGQVLTSQGAGLPPIFQTGGGGGSTASLSPYIVGKPGFGNNDYTSIQAAINTAVAVTPFGMQTNIYIKPGLYIENLTLSTGINLVGFSATNGFDNVNSAIVYGTVSFTNNTTNCCIQQLNLYPQSGSLFNFNTQSAPDIMIKDCNLQTTGSFFSLTGTCNVKMSAFNCFFNSGSTQFISINSAATSFSFQSFGNTYGNMAASVIASGAAVTVTLDSDNFLFRNSNNFLNGTTGYTKSNVDDLVLIDPSLTTTKTALSYKNSLPGFHNNDAYTTQATLITTTTATTPLFYIGVSGVSCVVQGTIIGSNATHTDSCGGNFIISARNGTLLPFPVLNISSTSTATFSAGFDAGRNAIVLNVTGLSGTYNWCSTYTYQQVSTGT